MEHLYVDVDIYLSRYGYGYSCVSVYYISVSRYIYVDVSIYVMSANERLDS